MTGPLIGFSGYARSGKDTAGAMLGWQRISFADKLRDFLLALDPMVAGHNIADEPQPLSAIVKALGWEGAKDHPVYGDDVRGLLQRCGTDAGHKGLGPNVWVDAALRDWDGKPAVVTDVRFPNEAAAIHFRGGVIIRITRPGVGPKRSADGMVHESEVAMDGYPYDGTVRNTGDIKELGTTLRAVLRMMGIAA